MCWRKHSSIRADVGKCCEKKSHTVELKKLIKKLVFTYTPANIHTLVCVRLLLSFTNAPWDTESSITCTLSTKWCAPFISISENLNPKVIQSRYSNQSVLNSTYAEVDECLSIGMLTPSFFLIEQSISANGTCSRERNNPRLWAFPVFIRSKGCETFRIHSVARARDENE